MATKFKPTTASRINESTDFSVKEIVRSKIIKYAQDRLNKSGAVLLAPVYDMINFNDPLDGMISFDYLNTIAENEELSEEESGYDYIEQAVTDIANFIQNQGFIMDEDSDDPLVFIDENYDEEDDEELDDMNESVKWTETDEPNQWVNKLTKNKEAIDPITLECKDLGVAVFASKLSEDADNNFYKVMIVNSNTGKSMTKSLPFDGIDLESAISKLKKCDNKDDLYDTISKYLFLRKSDVFKLFGISMNESASITKTDNYDEFNLLPPGNKFMDPIKLENKELGIWATAGVMFDEDDPDNEDDYSAVVLVSPLDPKYENYVVAGDFGDNYSASKNIMKKLAQIKTPDELAKIIKDKKFSDYNGIKSNTDFLVDVVRKLYSKMNESTVMNEAASIKKSDRYREFDLLPKGKGWMDPIELTNRDAGFYAIAGTAYDSTDRNNEDEWGIIVSLTPLDSKYEDILITGSFYDYEEAAEGIMKRLSRAKTPSDVARIINNQEFSDEWGDDESEFLSALTKSFKAQNESTMMNEAVQVTKPKPNEAKSHYISKEGSTMIQNKQLGFYAIIGDYYDEDEPEFEGDISAYISTLGTSTVSIDDKKINEVLESTFDNRNKANTMMKELSDVDNLTDLAKILRKYEFYNSDMDTTKGQREFISILESKISNINESTVMNESAQIRPCDPALEGFDLLGSNNPFDFEPVDLENEELGFYAIAGVATGANPGAVWVEDDCSIEICITALDPDYTDEVLVAEYYDVDYKAMSVMKELASATSYNKLISILVKEGFQGMNSGPFDFVDDLEAINSMNEATEVPDGRMTVELDDTDVVEGDTLLLAELTDDVFNAVNTVLDELDPDADVEVTIDNEDLLQLAVISDEDLDDDTFDQVLSELLEDMDLEDIVADMTDSEPIEDPDDEDFGRVIQYINFYPATGATVVPDNSVMEDNIDVIEDEDVINESASTKTDFIELLEKLADEFKKEFKSNPDVEGTSFSFVKKGKDKVVIHAIAGSVNPGSRALSNYLNFLDDNGVEYKTLQKFEYYKGALNCTIYTTIKIIDIKDEDVINESTAPDYSSLANKVKDCIATYYSDGVVQRASVEVNKNKDSVVCVDLKFPNRDGIDAKEAKAVSKLVLSKFDNLRTLSNKKEAVPQFNTRIDIKGDCLVYYVMPYNNARPGEAILARYNFVVTNSSMNESFKLNTDLTKFVDKLADSFFGSIKDANFLNLEDEDGNLYFQVSTGDKSYSRKLLTNFLAFLAKKNVDFDLVNKVNVTGNSTFWNATVIVKINNEQGSQVQYRNELNESTEYNRISHYVDDLNFKSGVKFLEGDDKIEKVLKAINPKADIRFYGLDKLPWTTYKIDGRDYVAVFGISGRLFTPMAISITDGKNISDFINNSKSILTFTNKKLQDWNNVVIPVRIMNNLAKVTDRASEYKAIKSLLTKYEKQVYNYEQFDESVDPIYESYYKDTDEDLSIDQAKITKALKAISRILTKEGYPLDNLDKVYRFNYPRPGLVEINLINTLKSTYGYMGNKAYDIDSKIEKKLESLNLTYASKDKYGKEIYTDDDKLVHYDGKDISKYIQTGKVPDREFRNNRVDAVHPKLEEIAKGITEYLTSHPTYKKYNTYGYKPVNAGADYISIKVEVANVEYGKEILSDTDKYIKKNYKDLYPIIRSNPPDKKYPYIHYSLLDTGRPLGHLMKSEYEMRGSSIKKLMNESVDDDNSESIASYDYSESAKSPKLPTQSELKTIIQKSMIKFGERHTQVTVHAYRTSKYEGGVVEVDLDGTSLATDGREEDYYDEDNIKNALEYAAKELVDKFGQDKDLLDYIDVQYNKVGSLTITFSLDSELNESYSMNEATKVTFHFDDQKDWVSPEDFKKIEKFATKMEDALERYLRRLRDLGPDDKLKDQVYTEIRVENKEKIIIETKTKNKVLKKDIDRLYAKGNGPDPSTNLSQLPLDEVKATSRGIGWGISPIDKSLGIYVYTGFKSLAEPWDPAKAKAEWDAAHPKKPASALKSKLEEIAKGIEKYVKSHPDYKKFNLSKDVVHVGEDYIQITVDTPDVEVGKSILIDTDKFISKNYKDLETHSQSKDGSKPVWSVYVMKSSAAKDLMNEATKFDFDNLEEVLEEDLESDIDLPDYADNIIVNSYATGYGYGVKATFDDRLVKDNKLRIISRIVKTIADRCGKDYDLDHHHDKMRGEYSLTLNYKGSPVNESANYNKLSDKLETDLSDDIDNISDKLIVSVDETEYGHDIIVEFDDSLLGSNPNKIINQIAKSIQKRNGKYDDLIHYRQKYNNTYKLVFKYKGSLNECAIIKSEDTDYNALQSEELTRVLNSEQPLVDPYDIRCTIRPVFVRKDQFLFDGSTVYKATANASTDKDSGTTEIKVDVLLSTDPDISDASMTLTLPTEFDGLKLLRGNPTKVYNESADVKADTVTLSFANEDEANEFIKDNGVKPEKSFEGKFGWTVILKKSDLKKIK